MFTINKQQGFTLIEIIMFLVIVSTALGGITLLFVQTGKSNADPMIRQKAITIAYAYLNEISKQKWNENTPAGGGLATTIAAIGTDAGEASRTDYDDIDDYHGLNSPPTDANGAAIAEYSSFNVKVDVTEPSIGWEGIPTADMRKIKVTVDTPTNESFDFVLYRVNF